MKNYKILELSHDLIPGQEEYQLEVQNRFVDEMLPEYVRPPQAWYIMSVVKLWSHVGTHMESPYHYLKDGGDVATIPLKKVVGECLLIDFSDKKVREPITAIELKERGKNILDGDIVFIRTNLSHNYRTAQSHDRPYFTLDAIQWLVDRKISCLGVDCSGIEKRGEPSQPDHEMLFKNGIPLIEHLAHLEEITKKRFFVVAVPWRVHGLEASPVSVVAFVEED